MYKAWHQDKKMESEAVLEQLTEEANNGMFLHFGKHRGRVLTDVWHADPHYVMWMSGRREGRSTAYRGTMANIETAKQLTQAHCVDCCHELPEEWPGWRTRCVPCFKKQSCFQIPARASKS
jgi:uncharacterized protein (DUF3820 family)